MTVDYGVDLYCLDALDPIGRLVSGVDLMKQEIRARLSTPRGDVLDAPNYGIDLRSFMSSGIDARANAPVLSRVRAAVIGELLADERIQSVVVTVAFDLPTNRLIVTIECTSALGPFRLVLAVDKVTVAIMQEAA